MSGSEASDILAEIRGMRSDLRHIADEVKDHKKTLYGNGDIGLKTTVDRLYIKAENNKWLMRVTMASFVATAIKVWFDAII